MSDECRDVLIHKNINKFDYNDQRSLFVLELISRENFAQNQHALEAWYGKVGLNYDDFSQSYENLKSKSELKFNSSQAISALTISSPPDAVEAWKKCMTYNRRELFSWIEGNYTANSIVLYVRWAAPTGLEGIELKFVNATIARGNGKVEKLFGLPEKIKGGDFALQIDRNGKNTLVGTVVYQIDASYFSTDFFAPYIEEPIGLVESPYYLAKHQSSLVESKNIHGGIQFQKVHWNPKGVFIAGKNYTSTAVATHAPQQSRGYADFSIPKGAKYFQSTVGFSLQEGVDQSMGDAIARVYVDGENVWQGHLKGGSEVELKTEKIGVPEGAKVLRLETDSNGLHWADHVTWGDPNFTD